MDSVCSVHRTLPAAESYTSLNLPTHVVREVVLS